MEVGNTNMGNELLFGVDLFGQPINQNRTGPVAEKFGFPPFSVLDARQGEWQDRKRAWASLGIKSELGRSAACIHCPTSASANGETLKDDDFTSIFDPTLCECIYRWFCPNGGQVVDPFAGGSVRGVIAALLGLQYWGCDLREEQVKANIEQAQVIVPHNAPAWICGDSMQEVDSAPSSDLVFSCPPYGDLEKYSDDPNDLSNMEWHTFRAAYGRIILRTVMKMKQDSFACFVVGDFRDKRGFYRDFVSATIRSFIDAGAELYNEAVLVTAVGSASMRVTKQFEATRKFAKTHQNVLVFCKGDPRRATAKIKK